MFTFPKSREEFLAFWESSHSGIAKAGALYYLLKQGRYFTDLNEEDEFLLGACKRFVDEGMLFMLQDKSQVGTVIFLNDTARRTALQLLKNWRMRLSHPFSHKQRADLLPRVEKLFSFLATIPGSSAIHLSEMPQKDMLRDTLESYRYMREAHFGDEQPGDPDNHLPDTWYDLVFISGNHDLLAIEGGKEMVPQFKEQALRYLRIHLPPTRPLKLSDCRDSKDPAIKELAYRLISHLYQTNRLEDLVISD